MIPAICYLTFPGRLRSLHLATLEEKKRRRTDINAKELFTLNQTRTTRGHNYKLAKPRANLELGRNFLELFRDYTSTDNLFMSI
jgi:hypothetical protein